MVADPNTPPAGGGRGGFGGFGQEATIAQDATSLTVRYGDRRLVKELRN
jgi:hypothetical protein